MKYNINKLLKNKKKLAIYGFLMCAVSLGIVGTSLGFQDQSTSIETSIATENEYVNDDIPEHDGDILVDSLSIFSVSGEAIENSSISAVTSDEILEGENTDSYFEEQRATVDMDRNQVISMLTDVIAETESTTEKENAAQQKLKIIDYMEKEKMIENLIETKGLPEALVLITDNAVNVTIKKQTLNQADVAKICDIVMRETGRGAEQIVIQSKF